MTHSGLRRGPTSERCERRRIEPPRETFDARTGRSGISFSHDIRTAQRILMLTDTLSILTELVALLLQVLSLPLTIARAVVGE